MKAFYKGADDRIRSSRPVGIITEKGSGLRKGVEVICWHLEVLQMVYLVFLVILFCLYYV